MRTCLDCDTSLDGEYHTRKRCRSCANLNKRKQIKQWLKDNREHNKAVCKRWAKNNPRIYNKKERIIFEVLNMDELIDLLKYMGGSATKEDLAQGRFRFGRSLRFSIEAGLIEVDGDIIKLKDTPLLCAVDGYYEEKEKITQLII